MTFTCSMLLALAMSTGPVATDTPATSRLATGRAPIAEAVRIIPVRDTAALGRSAEPWRFDRPERRPSALPAMYAALGALNALDVYSTRRAIGSGTDEANPLMKKAAGSSGTMLAVKALSTAGTIFFSERAWKKNRQSAVVVMALINGTMAAITARNLRNAQ